MNINNARGFTLIEVLVSMIILSIGVLGLGILQLSSLRNTQTGYFRSQATILASDAVEAMRADIIAVNADAYQLTFAQQTPTAVNCYGVAANCSTTQNANADLNRWRTVLANFLPNGTGQIITTDIGGTTQVTVTVRWLDPTNAENGTEQLVMVTELRR